MTIERSRTGILGGTFNPIHVGHLRAAEEVCEILGLERMVFVPSADPPLKREGHEVIAPAAERFAWVRIAVEDNPRFEVDDLELYREGPSYSVDTLRILGERLAPERPVFVIGDDAFAELSSWRDPAALLALSHFAVIDRPGAGGGTLSERLPTELASDFEVSPDGARARHRSAGTWIQRVAIAALDVSSTDIRRRLGEGRSVRYLLTESVRQSVVASGIYATRPQH
jgi:nicotinate-nucleotide adenylyltransferase